jgi:hypothetical protein
VWDTVYGTGVYSEEGCYTMKHATILLAVLALALGASAQQAVGPEPYGVKGDKLGETAAEWLASNSTHKTWTCDDLSNMAEGKTIGCSCLPSLAKLKQGNAYQPGPDDTYAGTSVVYETVSFVAKDSKLILYKMEMTFNRFDFTKLMPALGDKFGTPAGHEVTPLQNGFGAKTEMNTWKWTNGVSSVEVVYIDAPDQSPVLTFTLDGPAKEVKERQDKAEHNKARSDM